MPSLNIRDVSEEQMQQVRVDAAFAGQTIRDYCLIKLGLTGEAMKIAPPRATKAPAVSRFDVTPVTRLEGEGRQCYRCYGPLSEWGRGVMRCTTCGINQ